MVSYGNWWTQKKTEYVCLHKICRKKKQNSNLHRFHLLLESQHHSGKLILVKRMSTHPSQPNMIIIHFVNPKPSIPDDLLEMSVTGGIKTIPNRIRAEKQWPCPRMGDNILSTSKQYDHSNWEHEIQPDWPWDFGHPCSNTNPHQQCSNPLSLLTLVASWWLP
jgi:hypothetical protein